MSQNLTLLDMVEHVTKHATSTTDAEVLDTRTTTDTAKQVAKQVGVNAYLDCRASKYVFTRHNID